MPKLGDSLEFPDGTTQASAPTFADLPDGPGALSGHVGQIPAVNVTETALEYIEAPPTLVVDDEHGVSAGPVAYLYVPEGLLEVVDDLTARLLPGGPSLSDSTPLSDATPADPGTDPAASRADHRHPLQPFRGLSDVPHSYTGEEGALLRVDLTATGLEFVDPATIGPALADSTPLGPGPADPGTGTAASRADHVHPTDSGALRAPNNLSDLGSASTARTNLGLGTAATKNTGTTAGTVAAGDDSRFGTIPAASSSTPLIESGSGAVGTGTTYARADHVHPVYGFANPLTTQDDLLVGGSSGTPARLGKGSDGQVLTVDPGTHHLAWATPATGMTNPMTLAGDLIVGGGGGAPGRLGKGSDGQVLLVASGAVAWGSNPVLSLANPLTLNSVHLTAGSSLPGSPSSGDVHFYTTYGVWVRYDGTRWLGPEQPLEMKPRAATLMPWSANDYVYHAVLRTDRAQYLTRWVVDMFVSGTNNGSNYWTARLSTHTGANTSVNTSAVAGGDWRVLGQTSFSGNPISSTDSYIEVDVAKTGSPGSLYMTNVLYVCCVYT